MRGRIAEEENGDGVCIRDTVRRYRCERWEMHRRGPASGGSDVVRRMAPPTGLMTATRADPRDPGPPSMAERRRQLNAPSTNLPLDPARLRSLGTSTTTPVENAPCPSPTRPTFAHCLKSVHVGRPVALEALRRTRESLHDHVCDDSPSGCSRCKLARV